MARRAITPELWTVLEVAAFLGIEPKSADKQLRRWGVVPVSREPGRAGRNLYRADLVQSLHAARPGQGARTDKR